MNVTKIVNRTNSISLGHDLKRKTLYPTNMRWIESNNLILKVQKLKTFIYTWVRVSKRFKEMLVKNPTTKVRGEDYEACQRLEGNKNNKNESIVRKHVWQKLPMVNLGRHCA